MTATSSSAATAAATANAYARHYVEFQNRRNERLGTAGLAKLQRLRDGASESSFAAYAKAQGGKVVRFDEAKSKT